MDQSPLSRIVTKLGIAILAVALIDLIYVNYWIIKNQRLEGSVQEPEVNQVSSPEVSPSASPFDFASPSPLPQAQSEAKTVETKTIIETPNQSGSGQASTQTIVQTAQKEIFVPIGSGSTNSNNYEDLSGLEVTIDTNKYSTIESAVFEASIWVQDGNGLIFAQLYNVSDKHPVWNSEISTNSAKGVLTTSQVITLDRGARTYKVQAKTNLTAYTAHVDNARIKITLK